MEVRALANNQPVAPRKVRLLLDMVRGRTVDEALSLLEFMPQPSARIVWKVIKSAAANAENNFDLNPDGLKIKSAIAGDARTLKRFRPRSRGQMNQILKRYSHITVVVEGDEF